MEEKKKEEQSNLVRALKPEMPAPRTSPEGEEEDGVDLRGQARRSRRIWSETGTGSNFELKRRRRGGGREKDGVLGGVQTRREARLLLSESPQSLYSAKVKGRRRAGGEASLPRRERKRARRLERERGRAGEGDGSEEGGVVCVGPCGVVNLVCLSYFWRIL
jgi:hypothetical protein